MNSATIHPGAVFASMDGVAEKMLAGVLALHMRCPETTTVDAWAQAERLVVGKDAARPGPWDNSWAPWLVEPMRCWTDPAVTDIVIMASTQSGKTETLFNCLLYTIRHDPRPCLYISTDQEAAKEFNDDRLIPTLEAVRALRDLVPLGDSRLIKRAKLTLPTMPLWLTGAHSAGKLARISVQRGFFDEIDKWAQELRGRGKVEGSAEDLARSRFDAHGDDVKRIWVSSPTDEMVGIHRLYHNSDQARWQVPCPRCGKYQELRFSVNGKLGGGVRWEGGLGDALDGSAFAAFCAQVQATAWYECEHCRGRVESREKGWMNARGVWVRTGQRVGDIDPQDPEPRHGAVIGEAPQTKVRGFHWGQLVTTWKTFGDVAEEFVKERGATRGWVNRVLGEPWKQPGQHTDAGTLKGIIESGTGGTPEDPVYKLRSVPAKALALAGAIDIQRDHAWFVVRGYGAQERSWLIDYGRVECPEVIESDKMLPDLYARMLADRWGMVEELVMRQYPRVNTGEAAPVKVWAVDSGHRTGEVYHFVERFRTPTGEARPGCPKMHAAKGEGTGGRPWWDSLIDDPERVRVLKLQRPARLMHIHSEHWKNEVWQRLHRMAGSYGCWSWPSDTDGVYMRQMTAEQRVIRQTRRGPVSEWKIRPGRKDNHFWDCEYMLMALVEREGLKTLGAPVDSAPVRRGPRYGSVRAM